MPLPTFERLPVLALALWAWGCTRPAAEGSPEQAYQAFAQAVRVGDAQGAYQRLSRQTREAAEQQARALSEASDGGVGTEPARVVFAPTRAPPLSGVRVVNAEGDVATVEAKAGGETQTVRMVKEDGVWRVDLAAAFAK